MIEELAVDDKRLSFNLAGLTEDEQALIREVALVTAAGAKKRFRYALERCTFFAYFGYPALVESLVGSSEATGPRIEGDDKNPFNQHYWVAFDLQTSQGSVVVVVDPIFQYVGRKDLAPSILRPDFRGYYERARTVPPNTPQWEGGVRIKTIGL